MNKKIDGKQKIKLFYVSLQVSKTVLRKGTISPYFCALSLPFTPHCLFTLNIQAQFLKASSFAELFSVTQFVLRTIEFLSLQ